MTLAIPKITSKSSFCSFDSQISHSLLLIASALSFLMPFLSFPQIGLFSIAYPTSTAHSLLSNPKGPLQAFLLLNFKQLSNQLSTSKILVHSMIFVKFIVLFLTVFTLYFSFIHQYPFLAFPLPLVSTDRSVLE